MPPISYHFQPFSPEIERVMSDIFLIENTDEFNLFRRLKAVTHLLTLLGNGFCKDSPLSHARMRILLWLVVKERLGDETGISPSDLSEYLGVRRNTVSALLNGLEESGFIERHLHATDRRQFVIQITALGRDALRTYAPQFAAFARDLFAGLTSEERNLLLSLLEKLHKSMLEQAATLELLADAANNTVLDPS